MEVVEVEQSVRRACRCFRTVTFDRDIRCVGVGSTWLFRSNSKANEVKVHGHVDENIAKVIGATSSEGFLVCTGITRLRGMCIYVYVVQDAASLHTLHWALEVK